jgi:hypothetical protein
MTPVAAEEEDEGKCRGPEEDRERDGVIKVGKADRSGFE